MRFAAKLHPDPLGAIARPLTVIRGEKRRSGRKGFGIVGGDKGKDMKG